MAWYNASWLYRVKVTVLAAKVDADLSNYPVYVDLSDLPADFHTNVKSDGGDIRVTTSDETTEVPVDLVTYDSGTDTGELHFKGNVSGSVDTDFYIYYGNSGASKPATDATYGAENVWTNGYEAVFHLQEGGTTSTNAYIDSSGNFAGGTGMGNVATNSSSIMGTGVTFDGTGDYIDIGTNTIIDDSAFTISAWIKTDTVSKYSGAVSIGATGTNNSAYIGTVATAQVGTSNSIGGGFYGTNYGSGDTTTGAWRYVVLTFAGGTNGAAKLYVSSGTPSVSTTKTPSLDATYTRVGRIASDTGYDFDGSIDEVRIASVERSASWVSTELNNQSSPSTFYSVGSQETGGTSGDDERSAKITGKASTDSSRSSKIYGAYVSPQYLYWTKINSDTKTLEKVVVYEKEVTKPSDSSVTWHASPDGGSNWESITAGTVHTFVNSGNDLRLRATLSASSDYKSTPSLDRVSVVWTELDSVSVNNERGAFISGQASTSDEREATITGRDTANDERSAKTVGSDSSNDERPIFLTGQDTGSDERPANITGQSTTTAESLAKTFGQDSDSDERQSKISGKNTANNEIGVKISGKATTNLEREAKIAGKNADSGEIQSKIVGKDTSEASRSAKVFGQDSTSDERNVKIAGQTATLDQRFSKTIGKDTIISIRPLKISGQDFSEDYRDVKITGKKSADSDRLAKIHGKGVDTSIRTLKITGKNSSTSESAARIVGSIDTSSQRQTTVKGQSTASSDVLVKITGQDSSFIAKLATIYGKDITNSQRSAKLVGVVGSGLSQRSARIKGSSKWYKPDPKTMSSDSPTTFQTSNPTDWYEPDPKTPMTQNDDGFSKPY